MIKQVIKTENIPIKLWLDDMEPGALQQAKNLANLPFAFRHIAIMPDAHQGYGMPIGGVMATANVIIPNAVGVDIGCGICAVKTSIKSMDSEKIKTIFSGPQKGFGGIRERIPLGFKHHKKNQKDVWMPDLCHLEQVAKDLNQTIVGQQYKSALKQVGTLGGGNHFIEIQKGSDGFIWLMIHSGSRNIGHKVATYYNKLANTMQKKFKYVIPKKWELAYFPLDSKEGQLYLAEMTYCVKFALANRALMMDRVKQSVMEISPDVEFDEMINIAHNYAALEEHFNKKVVVHRKGATKAFKETIGIIPGSQGTHSYIVRGLGNKESFMSCSHGAGRKMGRKQAIRQLDLNTEKKRLDKKGIVHAIRGKRDLDEAAGAYKNISKVMKNQEDLVEILVELTPLGVIKG